MSYHFNFNLLPLKEGDILAPFFPLISGIQWHGQGRGLASTLFPPVQQVQMEAGTHPVTVGFSTVWPSLTTNVPRVLTRVGPWFIPCNLYSYLCDYLFANKLIR